MKHRTLLSAGLALLLGATEQSVKAQTQSGTPVNNVAGGVIAQELSIRDIVGFVTPSCGPYLFNMKNPSEPWGQDYSAPGVIAYYSLPATKGPQTDTILFRYIANIANAPTYQFFVDGQYCPSCTVTLLSHQQDFFGIWSDNLKVTHQAGDAWSKTPDGSVPPGVPPNGIREFGLRFVYNGVPNADIQFRTVMTGLVYTDVLGYFDEPAVPLYILRDPPGDGSYSTLSTGASTCVGETKSVTSGQTNGGFFKGRVGIAGSIGLIATVDYEIYGEVGTTVSGGRTETATKEYKNCFTSTQAFTTPQTGAPDDVFIGTATRYAYGFAKITERTQGTCLVQRTADFAMAPDMILSTYNETESSIRESRIPDLDALIATLNPGTSSYKAAVQQRSVWQQTLDMNDDIKANAAQAVIHDFNGGGSGQDNTISTSITQSRSISYDVTLDNGFTAQFGANIGGSGVEGGYELHVQSGHGAGQSTETVVTNDMSYHLQDENGSDHFSVIVKRDSVFGTYVFVLDSGASETSCPYEGGYQLDQPSLSVGTPGNTDMIVNEAPLGSQVNYPLVICNNSNEDRTYHLKFGAATNTEGAVMYAFGNQLNSNDDGIELEIPAGECLSATNLTLEQPNAGVVTFEDIALYLYSLCDGTSSTVTISAYFGDGNGNFGDYCTPPSYGDIIYGNWIDGVQIGAISNTGTGATPPPDSNVDYSGSFTTDLSLNSQQLLTITPGTGGAVRCAAWIDYDHSGTFDADEKLGEFTGGGQVAQDIAFTVPGSALLGTTRMRVRGGYVFAGSEPDPMDACYAYAYSEIEDYAIVIDDETPLDCNGAPNGAALPGTACDDGNPSTGNDFWNANCSCIGVALDCTGTPGGTALTGTTCDDADANTASDVWQVDCTCAGIPYDCTGTPGGPALPGTTCNDADATTGNDTYATDCTCVGLLYDCNGMPGGVNLPGTACDDGNPLSVDDIYNGFCQCVGQVPTDCVGVPGGGAQPGTACDDGNSSTGNDVYGANCVCAGQAYDCANDPGGSQLPGTPCDDNNASTANDTFTADCACLGVAANDCLGVPGGTAQPGTACDDGDADTGNDVYDAFCTCIGQLIDCDGVAGGFALPGFPCDDSDATTGNDVLDNNCQCAGLLIDCEGVAGGTNTMGTACDDGNANTGDDVYNTSCICAGLLSNDCEGVAGGPAQPGTACDDGDATTGNDVYTTDCACAGQLIDCEGTIGGAALPGTACDDGVACTANDVRGADCVCSGTTITIGAVAGATTVIGNTSNAYVVTPVPNATSYTWTLPNGWTTSDNSAFVVVADVNNTPGDVELCVTAMVGACELTSCITVTVDFNTGFAASDATSNEWFTVQPNPNNGVFSFKNPAQVPTRVEVRDGLGRLVVQPLMVGTSRASVVDLSEVAAGSYYLVAEADGYRQVIKIMVQH